MISSRFQPKGAQVPEEGKAVRAMGGLSASQHPFGVKYIEF